jgi:hypothetical protein
MIERIEIPKIGESLNNKRLFGKINEVIDRINFFEQYLFNKRTVDGQGNVTIEGIKNIPQDILKFDPLGHYIEPK